MILKLISKLDIESSYQAYSIERNLSPFRVYKFIENNRYFDIDTIWQQNVAIDRNSSNSWFSKRLYTVGSNLIFRCFLLLHFKRTGMCMKQVTYESRWTVVPLANIPGFVHDILDKPNGLKDWFEPLEIII